MEGTLGEIKKFMYAAEKELSIFKKRYLGLTQISGWQEAGGELGLRELLS